MGESDDKLAKVISRADLFDRGTRFIKEVGFPMACAIMMFAYFWFVGRATNDFLARGTTIMERAISVIERMEKKLP